MKSKGRGLDDTTREEGKGEGREARPASGSTHIERTGRERGLGMGVEREQSD